MGGKARRVRMTEREASMVLSAEWPGTPWTDAIGGRRADELYRLAFTVRGTHWSHASFEEAKDGVATCIHVPSARRRR